MKRVRITVVDNYQGEESKIILLSLVRSNTEDKIGYLSLKNRICVALSRAKEGFYMIGNMNLLAKNSSTWKLIGKELQDQDAIGEVLLLRCQTHGNISKVKLFVKKKTLNKAVCGKINLLTSTDTNPVRFR